MADLGLLVPITGSARTSSARRWILIGGLLLLGGLLGVGLGMTWNGGLLLAGASAAVGLQALGLRRLVALLVGATFVTLFRIDVAGLSFRPEHFALVPCLAAVVLAGRSRALVDAALDRTVLLLGSFVAWNAIVSIFQAPDPGASLRIVGWLLIDWLILVTLVAVIDDPEDLARQGALWAGLASCVALAL